MKSILRYLIEVFIATVGAVAVGGVAAEVGERWLGRRSYIWSEPIWLGPILAAAVFGCITVLKFGFRKSTACVWIVGLLNFGLDVREWQSRYGWTPFLWQQFFGRNCGECLSQLFATAPLYTSLAFSAAAGLCQIFARGRHKD